MSKQLEVDCELALAADELKGCACYDLEEAKTALQLIEKKLTGIKGTTHDAASIDAIITATEELEKWADSIRQSMCILRWLTWQATKKIASEKSEPKS